MKLITYKHSFVFEILKKLLERDSTIISIVQYADSNSLGRNKAGTIYYKEK